MTDRFVATSSAPGVDVDSLGSGGQVTVDAMDGVGWTSIAPVSGESETWGGGKLTLAIPAATNSNEHCGVHRSDAVTSGESFDIAARIAFTSGDGDAEGAWHLRCGRNASNNVLVSLTGSGALTIGRTSGGSWGGHYVTYGGDTIGSSDRTSGQLWLRVCRRPGYVAIMWGVGTAGASPTRWTTLYSDAGSGSSYDTLNLSAGTWALIGVNAGDRGGVAAGLSVDVLSIRRGVL